MGRKVSQLCWHRGPAPAAAPSARTPVALRAPSVRADPSACTTFLDRTIFPTSLDIEFSLNPCPRKPGALYLPTLQHELSLFPCRPRGDTTRSRHRLAIHDRVARRSRFVAGFLDAADRGVYQSADRDRERLRARDRGRRHLRGALWRQRLVLGSRRASSVSAISTSWSRSDS